MTSRSPGNARRDALAPRGPRTARRADGVVAAAGRSAHRVAMNARKARDVGRCERFAPRSSSGWPSGRCGRRLRSSVPVMGHPRTCDRAEPCPAGSAATTGRSSPWPMRRRSGRVAPPAHTLARRAHRPPHPLDGIGRHRAPEEVVARRRARRASTSSALTDHDTTAGWAAAEEAARGHGIALVRGRRDVLRGRAAMSVHLLSYLHDPDDPALRRRAGPDPGLARRAAPDAMVELARPRTFPLTWDDVLAHTEPGATVGRPHIADALVARGVRRRTAPRRSPRCSPPGRSTTCRTTRPASSTGGRAGRGGRRRAGDRAPGRPRPRAGGLRRDRSADDGRRRARPASRCTTGTTRPSSASACAASRAARPAGHRVERLPRRGQAEPARREHHRRPTCSTAIEAQGATARWCDRERRARPAAARRGLRHAVRDHGPARDGPDLPRR